MRIIYEPLEGTDFPWLREEIEKSLQWVQALETGDSLNFWVRLQESLDDVWQRLAVALANYNPRILGFKAMLTNSAITVYPQV